MNISITTLHGYSCELLFNNILKIPGKIISAHKIWECKNDFYINTSTSSYFVNIKNNPIFVKILKETLNYSIIKIYE